MTVTAQTQWRHAGRVPYEIWRKRIVGAGGLLEAAERDVWEACGDDSALMLEFLHAESSYASDFAAIPATKRNPWNLQIAGVGLTFGTIREAALAWRHRLYDQNYKQGIYTKTNTIFELVSTYAPASDGNDPVGYTAKVVAGMNANGFDPSVVTDGTEDQPVTTTYGRVPHPTYQRRIVTNSTAWNDLGKRTIRAVVWHRMYGTLWGTDTYFRNEAAGKALTDYGVGVEATDGTGQAGVILMWNDPTGNRSPWASGPVNNPIDDGAKFVQRYGVNGVNRDAVSIEISGTSGSTALDAKARAAVVELTAYYADQYKVPWDSFPNVPGENRSFVMWHGEIYDGKRNSCPGPVVTGLTDAMIGEVKAILKQYQTAGATDPPPSSPVYAKPQPPAAGDSIVNGRIFLAHSQEYTTKKSVTPRIYADPGSDPTGPDIPKDTKVRTSHIVSDVGESADLTAVLIDGSRIPVKGVLI